MTDVERCISCGAVIPEGRQVCPICYAKYHNDYSEELAYLWKVLKKTESSLRANSTRGTRRTRKGQTSAKGAICCTR